MLTALLAGLGLGVLSVPHCAAMCGPLSQAACRRGGGHGPGQYQLGRIAGYAFIGALSGHVGRALSTAQLVPWLPLLFAALTATVMLLLARRIWPRDIAATPLITLRTTASTRSHWSRLQRLLPRHPAAFGLSTALLPCGALAAALLVSAQQADPAHASLAMAGFAVASAPGTWGGAWLLSRVQGMRSPRLLRSASILLVVAAALLVARPLVRMVSADDTAVANPSCH